MKRYTWILILIIGAAIVYGSTRILSEDVPKTVSASLITSDTTSTGFQRAEGPREWTYPEDLGPHPEYQTEWWYYTGNLKTEDGEHFGYQLTFFRRGLVPPDEAVERGSAWGTDQVYMAHFAISDIAAGTHSAYEHFTRGAAGLAGAQSQPYQVWLEDWSVTQSADGQYHLTAKQESLAIDLILKDSKGPVLQGVDGYSQKGSDPGNASYYYSQTRMPTTGTIRTASGSYDVNGLSWKDHEFSTSALSKGQVGWDWFSIQLDNETELMFFQLRRADGSIDPFSSGTWVSPQGETVHLSSDDFDLEVNRTWRSPESGAQYPSDWTVTIPTLDLVLEIRPYLADQEMNVSYDYWEGAVQVEANVSGENINGSGYVEMTGYAAPMSSDF